MRAFTFLRGMLRGAALVPVAALSPVTSCVGNKHDEREKNLREADRKRPLYPLAWLDWCCGVLLAAVLRCCGAATPAIGFYGDIEIVVVVVEIGIMLLLLIALTDCKGATPM